MLNSPFLVNGCVGLGNGTTSKVKDPRSKIANKEISNNKNDVCWAEEVGVDPLQGESPKFTCV